MSSNKIFSLALAVVFAITAFGCQDKPDGPDNPQTESADYLICTFNIRYIEPADGAYAWEFRKDAVCDFILKRHPDIIALQELEKESAEYIVSKVKDEYGFYGIGPTTGKDILSQTDPSSANGVLYRKTRFDLSAKGSFWHSDTPDQVVVKNKANDYGSWHTTHPLNTVWVKLIDKNLSGKTVWMFNTHFQNNKNCPNASGIRMMESNLHINRIPTLTGGVFGPGCKDAVFLLGDFNSKSESDELQKLITLPLGYARLDAAKSSFRTIDTDNGYGKGSGIIDHIFFCGPLKALTYSVDRRDYGITYISDHYPVLADFSITDK